MRKYPAQVFRSVFISIHHHEDSLRSSRRDRSFSLKSFQMKLAYLTLLNHGNDYEFSKEFVLTNYVTEFPKENS